MAQTLKEMLEHGITDLTILQQKGESLSGSVTTSQLRKFFGALKRIDADFEQLKGETLLLEPKLAYAVGRAKGPSKVGLKALYDDLSPLLRLVGSDQARFKNLVNVVEAIVAYHKFNGGKD